MAAWNARTGAPQGTRPSGDANVATLLTWLVPGAGHLYLGRGVVALVAFVVVEGLYLLGLKLSGGMVFEFLQPELRTRLAPALTPEAGNLGALIWHMKTYGFGDGRPRPFPSTIALGSALTALSGVLNVCLMVRAHVDARIEARRLEGRVRPSLAVLAGWLVPGLGHALLGRRVRGAAIFVLLVGLFALGTVLAEGSNLDRERHFYYWAGQFLLGLPALTAELVHGHALVHEDVRYGDVGVVFASLAGLLNVLALLDAYGRAEEQVLAPRATATEARSGTSAREAEEEIGAPA